MIGNWFCSPKNFEKSVKTVFFLKKYTLTFCVGPVWIVIGYFLLEKQTFDGLLKVIGAQNALFYILEESEAQLCHSPALGCSGLIIPGATVSCKLFKFGSTLYKINTDR